jgi:hypothetical protein
MLVTGENEKEMEDEIPIYAKECPSIPPSV